MQLIRRLLYGRSAPKGRNRLIRGLSTAELVGIIVVIGVLGALGATYITGLVSTANSNTGTQNAVTLGTLANSYVQSGGDVSGWGLTATPGDATAAITALNTGVTGTGTSAITYKMTPAIATTSIANYQVAQDATGMITFTHTAGTAP